MVYTLIDHSNDVNMFKQQEEPRAPGEWFHRQSLNILKAAVAYSLTWPVPRFLWLPKSFYGYSDWLLFTRKCYWPCFLSMFIFEARLIQRSTFPKLKLIFWHLNEILLSLSKSIQYDSKSIQSDIYHLILRSLLRFSKQLFQPK